MTTSPYIGVIDFGSQTARLIVRRVRKLGVVAHLLPANVSAHELKDNLPAALILSGGPESLQSQGAIRLDKEIFKLRLPMLGICYGMQLLTEHFSGLVKTAPIREFGQRRIDIKPSLLFDGINTPINVWMSHSDQVDLSGTPFSSIALSESCPHAAIEHSSSPIYGVQFHPEVSHSEHGDKILSNFLFKIAKISPNFDINDLLAIKVSHIKQQVGDSKVIMGLSGGVDSTVAAALIHRAVGDRLHAVYINHGLHRLGEIEEIKQLFLTTLDLEVHIIDAGELFFAALCGVTDPEIKRQKIGHVFIDVFEQEASRCSDIKFLGQGTLYSDVIESSNYNQNHAHLIKSHHNVGGLPPNMNLGLLEPLRDLFKDEARQLGQLLGLPDKVIMRQPFPGPGLAIRIVGEVTKEKVALLQQADAIVRAEIEQANDQGIIEKPWQWFAILLPVKSVGVMGDARTYGDTIVIRCVNSVDAMTADWAKLPYELLRRISSRITNEVRGISRVLYDITQKPPGTIEWE